MDGTRRKSGGRADRIGEDDPDVTIFQAPWWLDAVCDGHWQESRAGDGERAFLWLPYVETRRLGMRLIGMPPLTHTLGPVIRMPAERPATLATLRRKLIDGALADLPPHDGFLQVLDPAVEDALDYAIGGFEVGVRYTFRIDTRDGVEALWDSLKHNARSVIRKAAQAGDVVDDVGLGAFFDFYEANLRRRGAVDPHDRAIYRRLGEALASRRRHRVIAVRDRVDKALVAAALVVWDRRCLYFLRATRDPQHAGRGGGSLVLWEAIKLAASLGLTFDSDSYSARGSALYLEGFGAVPTARLTVSRRSRRLKAVQTMSRMLRVGT